MNLQISILKSYFVALCLVTLFNFAFLKEPEVITLPIELGEGPHWDNSSQKLYYVDLNGKKIMRYDPINRTVTSLSLTCGFVGVVIPIKGFENKFIVGCGTSIGVVKWTGEKNETDSSFRMLRKLEYRNDTRVNDGKCDPSGRLLIGTMALKEFGEVEPLQGSLYSIDNNFCVRTLYKPVTISNGLTWSLKKDKLYYIDSNSHQIWKFDYNRRNGAISKKKKIIFDLKKTNITKGILDGMTIDTDGNLWVAVMFGAAVIKVDPNHHKLLQTVKFPVDRVSSVAFGGAQLNELYVTTARDEMSEDDIKKQPLSGSLFRVTGLGVHGLPAEKFRVNRILYGAINF